MTQGIEYGENVEARSKLIQVFRYIQALNNLRNPPPKEIEEQQFVFWFHNLPNHPCIRRAAVVEPSTMLDENDYTDESGSDDFILKVSRPKLTEPPSPPREVISWLKDGWQNVDGKVIVESTRIVRMANGQTQTINFKDDPQRQRLLEEWKARRDKWVVAELPARRTMDLFERLYSLFAQFERESERLELMLGDGLLSWQPVPDKSIHHPVLLLHLQLRFDPEVPEFTLTETGQPSELYTAMLQTIPDIPVAAIGRCREDHAKNSWHPLGGTETSSFLKRMVSQISSQGTFVDQATVEKNPLTPYITRDPVIFVRPRTLGISIALEAILETLPLSKELAYSLTSLVLDSESNNKRDHESSSRPIDTPNGEDEHILLSKPANAEQLEIARRLERYGAVLVQGPPGTGKTHTIANLIGHLLAEGKSVLVTSEKPKALRVLREKVAKPLQPLCVSMLEDDSRKQMESTIDAISERLAYTDPDKLEREAVTLTRQRIEILKQLRETRQRLMETRGSEYRSIVLAGESYSPSEAARYVAQVKQTAAWIPGPVAPGVALPLSMSELLNLYRSNTAITARDERELALFLPEPGKLVSPLEFEQLIIEQAQLLQKNLSYRRDLWSQGVGDNSPEAIQDLQNRLINAIEPLRNISGWRLAAIAAGREGGHRRHAWDDLLNEVQGVYMLAAQAQGRLWKYGPVLPINCLPGRAERILDEIIAHLSHGGQLNNLKLLMKRDWKTLIECAKVNNRQPEQLEHFEALRDLLRLQAARENLVWRWQRQMAVLGGPDATTLGSAPENALHQYIDPMRRCLDWFLQSWAPLENELRRQGFQWDRFLAEMPVNHAEYGDIRRLCNAVVEHLPALVEAESLRRSFAQIGIKLLNIQQHLEVAIGSSTKTEVVQRLRDATKNRDARAYREAFESLSELHAKREMLHLRHSLLTKLEKTAPGWASVVRDRVEIHSGRELPGNPEEAWRWRQLYDELEIRTRTSLEELQQRITGLNSELYRITAELVEKKAWAAQVRHTTTEQRRALQGWRELMRKVGKGTGKRAPRLLAQARTLMPQCQTAVPVWIMPLSYVAKNFDMRRNRFDVVIIDEASQADITALIAVYMGSQVVVVGDDEQVSPIAVGQNLDDIQYLIDEHLRGIPLAQIYDSKLSIYGLARTTFEPICLREHFRCVSPIIQFSNDLSYDGKIKPLRDDSDVQRRPFTVEYRVRSTSKKGKINEEEAWTVASLLVAASIQPEYKDATFGVISMVGSDQAMRIEDLLHRYLSATEYVQRRVLCGDPAQFQGDERDVMFLSMVDIPGENNGPLRLRTEEGHDDMFKKRFNVAASRARDQMWVVHSFDPDIDLKDGDIRKRLILHARNPGAVKRQIDEQEQHVESEFEKQVFRRLIAAGYRVKTQWPVGAYRIDMVVEGNGKRLAVECDGDRWHTPDNLEADMARQAILERLGWRFVRIRGSQFFRDPDQAMEGVFIRLRALEIPPEGFTATENAQNHDGKELKERIIRQADELRQQWKERERESYVLPVQMSSPLKQAEDRTGNIEQKGIPSPVKTSKVTAPSTIRANTDSNRKTFNPASQPTSSNRLQSNTNGSLNPVLFFQTKGIKVIDNRDNGGGIWVVGGNELSPLMQILATKGIRFKFVPGGIPRISGSTTQYIDGWFTKL